MSESKPTTAAQHGPSWKPEEKRPETKRILAVIVSLNVVIVALVLYWIIVQPVSEAKVQAWPLGTQLAVMLAPVLAATAGIERFLETLFGIIEGNWRTLVAYLGRGLRWLHNAETEVENARQWLSDASAIYAKHLSSLSFGQLEADAKATNTTATAPPSGTAQMVALDQKIASLADERLNAAKAVMEKAEQRLKAAEDQLNEVTSSDNYRNTKRALAIYIGLLLGLAVATVSSLRMFAMMGITLPSPVGQKLDVIFTGLVIGGGSAPVHSLINILQSAKETLDSAQGWLDAAKNKGKK
jgi:hypothetical protein